ncbi:ROK family protein [Hymenobacter agri]
MHSAKYIGIDIGGTKIRIGVVQHGQVLRETAFATAATAPQAQILAELAAHLEPLLDADVAGIGIGTPGLVDEEHGVVLNVANIPSWREVHLRHFLTQRFGLPVYITNDANAFAVGEKMYGQGQPYANLVGLALGTGLGAGIIVNHQLYSGTLASAGEFGCIPYLDKTLEDYCSGKFFAQRTGQAGAAWHTRAQQGDAESLALYAEFGHHLGRALHIILFVLSPEAIVLGGSVSQGFAFFRDSLNASLAEFPFPQLAQRLVVAPSTLGNAAVLGAAALCHMKQTLPHPSPPSAV